MLRETWHSFDCVHCTTIVEVRVNEQEGRPNVSCPSCHQPMNYRGHWRAMIGGFGASGDHPDLAQEAVNRWLASYIRDLEALIASSDRSNPLASQVSIGGFLNALRHTWNRGVLTVNLPIFINAAVHTATCVYNEDESGCDCGLSAIRRALESA